MVALVEIAALTTNKIGKKGHGQLENRENFNGLIDRNKSLSS
jgi:hypothetical protein